MTTNLMTSLLKPLPFLAALMLSAATFAQTFSLDGSDRTATRIQPTDIYSDSAGYGYDFVRLSPPKAGSPYFFSVRVPDGNYRVTLRIGSKRHAAMTTVRAESRRLFVENLATRKGEVREVSFVVNKRNTLIGQNDRVRIKDRERAKLNWDDKLTLEVSGDTPACTWIKIEKADEGIPTLWLCGNSTVVDQDYEPWASWGQMVTRWFTPDVAIANYAESGETAQSFIAAGRLRKILSLAKPGDYIFIEFGHNDQKQKGPGVGAYYSFATTLKQFIDEAQSRGMTPIFVTPTQRRNFDDNGHIRETHADYPDAMRWVAQREGVKLIELHDMTRTFFETLGPEGSKQALVHYPANTFPGQAAALADNTHFNPYGAYQIAKMVVQAIKDLNLPIARHIRPDFPGFNPSQPDTPATFHWVNSPFFEALKPDGN